MNDQNSAVNTVPPQPIPAMAPVPQAPTGWKAMIAKATPILKALWTKFYSNKKIFLPVAIAFGLIFLVIVLGLLFGRKNTPQTATKLPTPSPFVQATPTASASGNIIIDSQNKLNDLKNQINALDVKQSRLQPPTLNFDIKF